MPNLQRFSHPHNLFLLKDVKMTRPVNVKLLFLISVVYAVTPVTALICPLYRLDVKMMSSDAASP